LDLIDKYPIKSIEDPFSEDDWKSWSKFMKSLKINNKNTFLIDVRKPFEHEVGTFKRAINPNVNNFREFPKYLKNLDKDKAIAMFCTGGIRCEKASIFLEKKGFRNVNFN